jgi:hypothetical protein
LLNEEGYTVRGVQKVLRSKGAGLQEPEEAVAATAPTPQQPASPVEQDSPGGVDVFRLIALRNRLSDALD